MGTAAVALLFLLLLCSLVLHALPIRFRQLASSRHVPLASSSNNVPFDPFRDDTQLRARLQAELAEVRKLSAAAIKAELVASGPPAVAAGVVDLADLQQLLAKRRILLRMRAAQDQAADAAGRERRAEALEEEMRRIRAAGLSELDMVRELQARQVARIDMAGDFVQQLAVARTRTPPPQTTSGGNAAAEVPRVVEAAVEGARGLAGAVPGLLRNATGATQGFVGRLGLTDVEVRAKEVITARNWGPNGGGGSGAAARGQSGGDDDVREAERSLSELVADSTFAAAAPEVAFDLVVQVPSCSIA